MVDADAAHAPDRAIDRFGRDPSGRRCSGTPSPTAGSPPASRGCHSWTPRRATWRSRPATLRRCSTLYRRLIATRRASPALRLGTHRSLFGVAPEVLAWVREAAGERVLVVLNVGDEERRCDLRALPERSGTALTGTGDRDGVISLDELVLEPLEGIALRL